LRLAGAVPPEPVVAVAAIARPDLFVAQLLEQGANVELLIAYADHHEYSPADALHIAQRAGHRVIVTTAKDAVKLRALMPEQPLQILEQEVAFESGLGDLMMAVDNIL
jgi:tetraacyldisaccharide 4'-kinase